MLAFLSVLVKWHNSMVLLTKEVVVRFGANLGIVLVSQ